MSKVVIIGGGAAGCMASISAASAGHDVTLLEQNEKLGKKIYITGKGRCNFTNACDTEDFFNNVVSNPKFLYSAIYTFPQESVIDFFEGEGIPTKIERGNRAFPVSDHASDITKGLERAMKRNKVKICLNTKVTKILVEDNQVTGVKLDDNTTISADSVIVCTGGLSYQTTGSTGDGLRFAKELGLNVTDTRPALVPFNTKEPYIFMMQGLSLKNVSLTIKNNGKTLYDEFGEMLFTHFGVSGPLVLSASSIVGKTLEKTGTLDAFINLKPALTREQIDERLVREFSAAPNKHLSSILRSMLPAKMVDVFIEILHFDDGRSVNGITKDERSSIVDLFIAFPFTITSLREFKEAIVTQGGVSVKEINPSTMESKNIKGLYFAGEVLDLDAFTGGFNLQIAFSTGYLAGISIE